MTTANNSPAVQTSAKPASVWSKIGSFFKHAEVDVADWFEEDFGPAAHTFAVGAEALLKTQLGQIALVAVQNAEALENSSEKWDAAGKAILAAAEQAGLTVATSLKNLLIELAVQTLKLTFGPSSTATE